jgi:hypothetical protein
MVFSQWRLEVYMWLLLAICYKRYTEEIMNAALYRSIVDENVIKGSFDKK